MQPRNALRGSDFRKAWFFHGNVSWKNDQQEAFFDIDVSLDESDDFYVLTCNTLPPFPLGPSDKITATMMVENDMALFDQRDTQRYIVAEAHISGNREDLHILDQPVEPPEGEEVAGLQGQEDPERASLRRACEERRQATAVVAFRLGPVAAQPREGEAKTLHGIVDFPSDGAYGRKLGEGSEGEHIDKFRFRRHVVEPLWLLHGVVLSVKAKNLRRLPRDQPLLFREPTVIKPSTRKEVPDEDDEDAEAPPPRDGDAAVSDG